MTTPGTRQTNTLQISDKNLEILLKTPSTYRAGILAYLDLVLSYSYNGSVSQVSSGLLQTAQTWANAGVCGGLCACAVGGTFD